MKPITGTPVNPNEARTNEEQMRAQIEANNRQLLEVFGRVPLGLDGLVRLVNDNAWPSDVEVHPLDFFFMTGTGAAVHKDNQGPYFYLSASRVRPAKGSDKMLDLSEWTPEPPKRIELVANWGGD